MQAVNLYRCPICNEKFESLYSLKMHVKLRHRTSYCPVCGFEGELVHHILKQKDAKHFAYYLLMRKGGKNRKFLKILEKRGFKLEQILEVLKA